MLAETIQLSGPEVAFLMTLFIAALLIAAAAAIGSVIAAHRAGKGFDNAQIFASIVAGVEILWLMTQILEWRKTWLWPAGLLAAQGVAYIEGRLTREPLE